MKYSKLTWLLLLVLISIIISPIAVSYAETINELKEQQKEVEKTIENTKEEMKSIEIESKNVEGEIEILDKKINDAAYELSKVEKELEMIHEGIVENEETLEQAETNLNEKTETFEKRLRVMYMNGNAGYLELLLSSNNIKDFLSRKNMIQAITEQDKELIKFMKEQRETIIEKKAELEKQKSSIETTKEKIKIRRNNLEIATRGKEARMVRLSKDLESLEAEYDKNNQLAKDIEKDIIKLQSVSKEFVGGKMKWPVPGHSRISSPFGYRIHPILKKKKMHTGIDIPAPTGSDVVASLGGTIIHSGNLGGYGKVIMVDHGGGIVTLYAHNSSLIANNGDVVNKGDVIAKIGSTGMSTGPHSHFEVRKNGAYENPVPWVKGN